MNGRTKMINSKSDRIDWKSVVKTVKEELKPFQQQGFKPSLRTIFYRIVSKNILPNTIYHYQKLSKYTADARMDRRLPIDCFADDTRHTIKGFNSEYMTIDEIISDLLKELKNIPKEYPSLIPRWHKQPEYIEIWNEKQAMEGTFKSILKGKQVEIVSNKGFSSLSFLWKNMRRLDRVGNTIGAKIETIAKHGRAAFEEENPIEVKNVHILYFGDFDPSGEEMDEDLMNRINELHERMHTYISFDEIDFQRIAVTKKQIEEYNLPTDVDIATQEKLDKDTRTNGFVERHGKLYAVELDALPAIVPDAFRNMVIDSVDRYFDEEIYEDNMKDYSEDDAKKLTRKYVEEFLGTSPQGEK